MIREDVEKGSYILFEIIFIADYVIDDEAHARVHRFEGPVKYVPCLHITKWKPTGFGSCLFNMTDSGPYIPLGEPVVRKEVRILQEITHSLTPARLTEYLNQSMPEPVVRSARNLARTAVEQTTQKGPETMPQTTQEAYCQYLKSWADSHSDIAFDGCTPACFDEWATNERTEIPEALLTAYTIQIAYAGQETPINDTAVLFLPDAVTPATLRRAIDLGMNECTHYEPEDNADVVTSTGQMLDQLADRLGGSWKYADIFGAIVVDEYNVRKFS